MCARCTFIANTALDGGALGAVANTALSLRESTFASNSAKRNGLG